VSPLPSAERRTLQAVGARRRAPGPLARSQVVETLRKLAEESPTLVALFDARAIAGERHLMSAWAHMERARARGEARLRDRAAEFALFVAGDDQLPRALGKVGVSDETERFVLVAEKPRSIPETLAAFDLEEDPMAYPRAPDGTTLDRLGIGEAERGTIPRAGWEGLVLERVALVDMGAVKADERRERGGTARSGPAGSRGARGAAQERL
jgi:tRNA threonylcarbamoyladenosine modification (KEOPS) complex Cgi121 subunit